MGVGDPIHYGDDSDFRPFFVSRIPTEDQGEVSSLQSAGSHTTGLAACRIVPSAGTAVTGSRCESLCAIELPLLMSGSG